MNATHVLLSLALTVALYFGVGNLLRLPPAPAPVPKPSATAAEPVETPTPEPGPAPLAVVDAPKPAPASADEVSGLTLRIGWAGTDRAAFLAAVAALPGARDARHTLTIGGKRVVFAVPAAAIRRALAPHLRAGARVADVELLPGGRLRLARIGGEGPDFPITLKVDIIPLND